MDTPEPYREAGRQLTICNACRYCEGYCAVFPAMELRRVFTDGDIAYLANLCHDCRACYHACMYAPPHEFGVNIPEVLSEVRQAVYQRYSWPAMLARQFTSLPAAAAVAAGAVVAVAALAFLLAGPSRLFGAHRGPGAFYEVISYPAIVIPGLVAFGYWIGVWAAGGARFWRETGNPAHQPPPARVLLGAIWDMLILRYLRGGGPGCPYPRAHASHSRAVLHALVYYGFLAALVSTTLAAVYQDLLRRLPPYPVTSAPVVFGTLGGVAMIAGITGLIVLKIGSDRRPAGAGAINLDYVFLITLGLASLTGILALVLRATEAMGAALTVHLGLVAALFVTAPYGKFVHAVYRFLALVRNQLEQAQSGNTS
jgi:citrate/tricarballylate utilization protein